MAMADVTIPTLPARDLQATIDFYAVLGFQPVFQIPEPEGYVILRREDGLELHFFSWSGLDPASNYAGCYIRVSDVDAIYRAFAAARLAARGIPSLGGIEAKFWKMREFRLVDPDGNLIRVGEEVAVPVRAAAAKPAGPLARGA